MRLAEIQAHIGSIHELSEIVGAMRSLAGMRLQETLHALPAAARYTEAVGAALASTLPLMAEPVAERQEGPAKKAAVLYMAEHSFVGSFNARLLEAAEGVLGQTDLLFVLGSRGSALVTERGREMAWKAPMATRLAGAPEIIYRLVNKLYALIANGEVSRVEAVYARHRQGGAPAIETRLVLPLDLKALAAKQPRQPPLFNLKPVALHESLMAEYVFAMLTEAAVESIASENAERFAAMESAHGNVEKKLQQLKQQEGVARQGEITTELLELITGSDALAKS
ncbi:F0F1 ATP synthase subunit gamma [Methylocystis echinoides]|uniref:H+-transporting ATP synthase subunit gamma n=1 Tax=Methylocystis echinoides TaxID=29468 RepID=A0A9W6GZR9_9HYPH|nr:F0F1 ATP synthase subunit gamma [Methylocystis echinoides]GLI95835.1 H+-transporting ATP synthase subunit gamma [Methylocystis echinoides]